MGDSYTMEILKQSQLVEETNREIASQPQSRSQVLAVSWQEQFTLWPVDSGEMVLTVIKGRGLIRSGGEDFKLEAGDQVYLHQGDEFGLLPADSETAFVVQMYWSP